MSRSHPMTMLFANMSPCLRVAYAALTTYSGKIHMRTPHLHCSWPMAPGFLQLGPRAACVEGPVRDR
jgi:hypothetical protein